MLLHYLIDNTLIMHRLSYNEFVLRKGIEVHHCNRKQLYSFIRSGEATAALQEMETKNHNTAEFGINGYFTISYNTDIVEYYKENQ